MDLGETFWKVKTLLDFCYDKKSPYDINEIMSMWYSNFTGEEIMAFREQQGKIA